MWFHSIAWGSGPQQRVRCMVNSHNDATRQKSAHDSPARAGRLARIDVAVRIEFQDAGRVVIKRVQMDHDITIAPDIVDPLSPGSTPLLRTAMAFAQSLEQVSIPGRARLAAPHLEQGLPQPTAGPANQPVELRIGGHANAQYVDAVCQ